MKRVFVDTGGFFALRSTNDPDHSRVLESGRKDGMVTMDQCLLDLYQKGTITYDDAVSRARLASRFTRGESSLPVPAAR